MKNFFHFVVERPVRFICKCTIPCSEAEKWHRGYASFNPPLCLLLFLVASNHLDFFDHI